MVFFLLFFFKLLSNILQANNDDPDQTQCSTASDLSLLHKKDARMIWIKKGTFLQHFCPQIQMYIFMINNISYKINPPHIYIQSLAQSVHVKPSSFKISQYLTK